MIRNECAEHVSVTAFLVRSLRRRWIRPPHREKACGLELEYLYEYRAWPSGKDITKALVLEVLKTETELNTRSILTHDLHEVNVCYFIRLNILAVNGVVYDLKSLYQSWVSRRREIVNLVVNFRGEKKISHATTPLPNPHH